MSEPIPAVPADPFASANAADGYHVVRTKLGDYLAIDVQLYAAGRLAPPPPGLVDATLCIASWTALDALKIGACRRLQLCLDAVARYLNTGGAWATLDDALGHMRRLAVAGADLGPWYYADGSAIPYADLIGFPDAAQTTYQHVFVRQDDPTGRAVLWQEPACYTAGGVPVGGFIIATTVAALNDEPDDHEQEETATPFATGADAEAGTPWPPPRAVPLRLIGDGGPAQAPPGPPGDPLFGGDADG
jgi:hypothetical protein